MKRTLAFASLCILSGQSPLMAEEVVEPAKPWYNNGSFYGSLAGGVAIFGDGNVNVANNPSGAADFEFDTGAAFAMRLGHDFGFLRVEGEFNFTQADVSSLDTVTGAVSVGSQFTGYGFMANALWDHEYESFVFSAGAGIGFTRIQIDEMSNAGFIAVAESSDTVFSGQLILGVRYQLNEDTAVGMNFRYLMASELDDNGYVNSGPVGQSDISFDNFKASIFEVFVTWRF